jgi:hypothetical protein
LHLFKMNCLALWLDERAHACTRSELRGASCEDWKSALTGDSVVSDSQQHFALVFDFSALPVDTLNIEIAVCMISKVLKQIINHNIRNTACMKFNSNVFKTSCVLVISNMTASVLVYNFNIFMFKFVVTIKLYISGFIMHKMNE